jgi:predicted nucleic acid-binding protein
MRVLLDTSVLVAALVRSHPRHAHARPWLTRALAGEIGLVLAAHSLAELHATLTSLPVRPRISPHTAARLRDDNLPPDTEIVALTAEDYRIVLGSVTELGLAGGVVYDALIARAAEIAEVDRLLTLNERDFRRVWPEGDDRIGSP